MDVYHKTLFFVKQFKSYKFGHAKPYIHLQIIVYSLNTFYTRTYSVTFDFRNLATDPNLTRSMHDKNVVNNLYN